MPAARSKLKAHPLAYLGLAVLFLLTLGFFGQGAFDRLDAIQHAGQYVREPFYLGDGNWGSVDLQPEAEAAGLKYADRLLEVNGRPVDGFITYYGLLGRSRPGDRLRVRVRTPNESSSRDLVIELKPSSNPYAAAGILMYVDVALRAIALPLLFIGLGFWVAAVRIHDSSAWLVLVVLLSLATFLAGRIGPQVVFGRDAAIEPLFIAYSAFFGLATAPALMLFGITFPTRLAVNRFVLWLLWIVAGYLFVVAVLESINVALWIKHLAWARPVGRPVELLTGLEGDFGAAVQALAYVVFVGSLAWKTMTSPSRDARRRLLILGAGAAISVTALLVILITGRYEARLPGWSIVPLLVMMPAFPLTMAYGIVVHRAMDVRVAIRQGLQYVLAAGTVRALQVVLGAAIVVGATLLSANLNTPRRLTVIGLGITMIFIVRTVAERLRGWVDRLFFREAYEADAILSDLALKVRTIVETKPLLETVATRIGHSLHVPRIAILLDGGGRFVPAYTLGYPAPPAVAIPEKSLTVTRLRKQQHAFVQFDDENSWVQSAESTERESLEQLKTELLIPLSLNEKLLGIMSLGAKQSEEPFSRTDIRLLDSVAAQTGLALENGRLTAAITAEVAAREKQKRELEIAHEVQERLFPQEYPPIAGVDYAGSCRPALDVGGDYYDFIALSKTELGIAIGDVSGKGIPAALLMATLRAFLRGQTMQRQSDLTAVMANLNKLVYDSSTSNRYATFFYGEFDATSRVLTYVNGGHNPPMLFRQADAGRDVVRLDVGGPVIGLIEDCFYQQGSVTFEAGDVLVAYTDGISEAMNDAEDEWGEERLTDAVRPNRRAPSLDLIDRIMKSADAFVAGAPQHDDMTLVVLRMT